MNKPNLASATVPGGRLILTRRMVPRRVAMGHTGLYVVGNGSFAVGVQRRAQAAAQALREQRRGRVAPKR
jgi:hypothetical protein